MYKCMWNKFMCSKFADGGAVIVEGENYQSATLAMQASIKKEMLYYSWWKCGYAAATHYYY